MFYKNLIGNKKINFKQYKCPTITNGWAVDQDEKSLPYGSCACSYNFDESSGVLKDNFGISVLQTHHTEYTHREDDLKTFTDDLLPTLAFRVFFTTIRYYQSETNFIRLMLVVDEDCHLKTYRMNSATINPVSVPSIQLDGVKRMNKLRINGVDNLVFTGPQKSYAYIPIISTYVKELDNSLQLVDIVTYNNRSFANSSLYKNTIFYSEEFNPLNFDINNDESGRIVFEDTLGDCTRVMIFKNKLYVIRQFGISKIVKGKDKKEFETENMCVVSDAIAFNSAVICGDKMVFATGGGIYEFDGNKATRIVTGLESRLKNKKQYGDLAAYNQGKYYLCCKLDFGDDEYFTVENYLANHNCIMIMDVDTHKYSLVRGVEITDFANLKDMSNQDILAVVYSTFQSYRVAMVTDSGAIYNAPKLKKCWESNESDFGYPDRWKFIKDLKISTAKDITLRLTFDGKSKDISVTGKSTMQSIKINRKVKRFKFKIIAMEAGNEITLPVVTAGVL